MKITHRAVRISKVLAKKAKPDNWPRAMSDNAYHGLAGRVVDMISPHTEADEANLLISFLIAFGNSIGRKAHVRVGATRHYTNEFAVMVGPTSTGRKGTGWDQIEELFRHAEQVSRHNEIWVHRIKRGLSTGEGMIAQIVAHSDDDDEGPKVADSRLMLLESEFARVLTVMNRPDNTLSAIIRSAWETGKLSVMTRKNPLEVNNAHVSIIGQITDDELRKHLNATERANGFANRFVFAMVRRSKPLPFGGKQIDYTELAEELSNVQRWAQDADQVRWGSDAKEIWPTHYERLTAEKFGMLGALTSRGAPHVLRLAIIYALLDRSKIIRKAHLLAALEVWRYCEASAKYIFGMAIGDDTADTILRELQRSDDGLTRTAIYIDVFSKNKSSSDISRALELLERDGLARCEEIKTTKRSKEVWHAINT
jgi:Protein of unknown function (DUF3987)